MNSPENEAWFNSINTSYNKEVLKLIAELNGQNIPPGTYTVQSPDMNDIFKKQSMEKQLEELLVKPEWQEYFMNMLVEHLEQPIKINEPAILKEHIPMELYYLVGDKQMNQYKEISQYFNGTEQPEKFYDLLKKHIKPASSDKEIFDSKRHSFCEGAFSEKDVWWHPKGSPRILASQMLTKHLFSSVEYIYNRCMPLSYRTKLAGDLTVDTRLEMKHIFKCMFYQIGLRDDLTEEQLEKLTIMAKNVRLYL